MARKKQSSGSCNYCQHETVKGKMGQHLATCAQHQEIITKSAQKSGKIESLYHLRVQDAGGGDFWLDLEMCGRAKLKDLDKYLRAIWLECCNHMSQFSIGKGYEAEISQNRLAEEVFQVGTQINHLYDWGSSSETLIKVVGVRQGKPTTSHPIALMARNLMPEAACIECQQLAGWLCQECVQEGNSGTLCATHVEIHPHDDYGEPFELVNSPRMGICGYEGPAKPPY